jgi:two-component sensor histidine kinase
MATGGAEVVEEQIGEEGDEARVWLSTKTPLRNAGGEVMGLVGVSLEITERKRVENRLHLMVHELNHRVKNTLATVLALAGQTLRDADAAVRQAFDGRLMALAVAHDVLTRESWEGANLSDVVAASLAPYGGDMDGRFGFSGPPIRVLPRAALALVMGLHELTTNALKYGALSNATGSVDVQWTVVGQALRLSWLEVGGPPVIPPTRRGFGAQLVERSVARDLCGTASIDFAPHGVACVIEAPLTEIAFAAKVLHLPRVGRNHAR